MSTSITAQTANYVPAMLEQVRPKLESLLVKKESGFAKKFTKSAEKHNVTAFTDVNSAGSNVTWSAGGPVLAWRVPLLRSVGGDYQVISLDGGDLGTGSGPKTAFMAFSTFETAIGFNIPLRAIYASKDQKQSIINALQFSVGNALTETALYNEIGLFGDSTGVLATGDGTGTPALSSSAVTYNIEPNFRVNRLRGADALVDVYTTAGLLAYVGARVKSLSADRTQLTLTVTGSYSPINTDQIAFPNMGLGAAAGAYSLAAGSYRNGIYLFNSTATSGSLGGLSYATVYEMLTPRVDAGSGFFTPSTIYAGKSQLVQRRDDEATSGIIGVCAMAQRTSWYLQGMTISNWFRGKSDQMIDLAPGGHDFGDTFTAGDVTHYVSRYADKSRVDWINPGNFGWAQLSDIDFVQTPDGQKMFMGRAATTLNPAAGVQFYVANTRQLYDVDPGCGVVFSSLAIPSGQ